jgi:hypothetical protein
VGINGTPKYYFSDNYISGVTSSSFYLTNEATSRTNPTLGPRRDLTTGLGSGAASEMSLIAGSVEIMRIVEGANDYVLSNTPIFIDQRAAAVADIADAGQLWVKSDTPNTLWFTNDVGTDYPIGYNNMPIKEQDITYTFAEADKSHLIHKDANAGLVFYCDSETSITQGATWVVHNADTEDLTITANSPCILYWLEPGQAPTSGDVLINQGGIVTVYKYANDEYWIWGAAIPGATSSVAELSALTDVVSATNTNRYALMANGTTGYVGRLLVEADLSDLGPYNNYSLPLATASVRGGVKIGYTENAKNYPVELLSEQMFVNVPWTDTVYSLPAATTTVRGGIELEDDTVQTTAANTVTTTANRTYGLQVNAAGQGVINVPWTDSGYTHPTHPGDDISLDTTALTGATVISDIDWNITTDTLGHVTDATLTTLATREFGFNDLAAKTSGTGNYQTTGDIIASNFQATDTGPNTSPSTDDAYIGGYGILGNRGAVYVSNVGGPVILNHGGLHGVNAKLTTSATGVSVTGNIAVTGTVDAVDIAALNTAVAKTADSETITGTWTFDGVVTTADYGTGGRVKDGTDTPRPIGFNVMPVYTLSTNDSLDLAHNGMLWYKTTTTGGITWTAPHDTNIPIGATYAIVNDGNSTVFVAAGASSTLRWADGSGDASLPTGTRTLAHGAVASVVKTQEPSGTSSIWIIWGAGIT